MTMYDRIKSKTTEIGLNFKQLERELGFGNGTLRKWEFQNPSFDKVLLVANRLNVSLDWLVTGKNSTELSEEEQKLIDNWRRTNDQGRTSILSVAESMALTQPRHEQSLTSKSG